MPISENIRFGLVRELPKNAEESRVVSFILSTMERDRHGTVLNQENWMLDNYRKNPVVAYQHSLTGGMCTDPDPDFVVGKDIDTHLEGKKAERRLIGNVEFEPADINLMAEKVFRKVMFGSLNMASVGFLPVGKGWYGMKEEDMGGEHETYYFEGQELLEWSIVNIPSNPGAGKKNLRHFREQGYAAFMYAFRELGGKFRISELEDLTVRNILDLLDGKDLELKSKNPEEVAELIADPQAQKDTADMIARQQEYRKTVTNSRKGSINNY
jgi:hypothetical protein